MCGKREILVIVELLCVSTFVQLVYSVSASVSVFNFEEVIRYWSLMLRQRTRDALRCSSRNQTSRSCQISGFVGSNAVLKLFGLLRTRICGQNKIFLVIFVPLSASVL